MVDQFQADGILKCGIHLLDENRKVRVLFDGDIQKMILNAPNPIPKKIKQEVEPISIIKKLSCSNLSLSEIKYLNNLIKKEILNPHV